MGEQITSQPSDPNKPGSPSIKPNFPPKKEEFESLHLRWLEGTEADAEALTRLDEATPDMPPDEPMTVEENLEFALEHANGVIGEDGMIIYGIQNPESGALVGYIDAYPVDEYLLEQLPEISSQSLIEIGIARFPEVSEEIVTEVLLESVKNLKRKVSPTSPLTIVDFETLGDSREGALRNAGFEITGTAIYRRDPSKPSTAEKVPNNIWERVIQ